MDKNFIFNKEEMVKKPSLSFFILSIENINSGGSVS